MMDIPVCSVPLAVVPLLLRRLMSPPPNPPTRHPNLHIEGENSNANLGWTHKGEIEGPEDRQEGNTWHS